MNRGVIVKLTWPEVNAACQVALFRQTHNTMRGISGKFCAPEDFCDGLVLHMRGCLGEIATAKYLNVYWSGVVGMHSPDVVFCVDVRTRQDMPNRNLILHDKDPDDAPFVVALSAEDPTSIRLAGWIYAKDGKRRDFWGDPSRKGRPAYFVPNEALRPMDELKFELSANREPVI
jgi:hypothetical protein